MAKPHLNLYQLNNILHKINVVWSSNTHYVYNICILCGNIDNYYINILTNFQIIYKKTIYIY